MARATPPADVNPRRSLNRTVPLATDPAEAQVVVHHREHLADDLLGDEAGEGVVDPAALERRSQVLDREGGQRGQGRAASNG